ncbi:hypothetical protein [Sphingomonas sp.]|uniref:hypothetical protein n=1 Tax=Sphingomonas sp. TaxID=28214 RepID=UPI001EBCAB5F|nr:hypothetical protein [Sphingomonas sp.]MBX3595887.1 hypothetical protein [Sphingomonas sp.]
MTASKCAPARIEYQKLGRVTDWQPMAKPARSRVGWALTVGFVHAAGGESEMHAGRSRRASNRDGCVRTTESHAHHFAHATCTEEGVELTTRPRIQRRDVGIPTERMLERTARNAGFSVNFKALPSFWNWRNRETLAKNHARNFRFASNPSRDGAKPPAPFFLIPGAIFVNAKNDRFAPQQPPLTRGRPKPESCRSIVLPPN